MHLVEPLIAGIAGAENGYVSFVRRGTSTRASYYLDFEGTEQVVPTTATALDANGGGVFYVDELVDVRVYSSGVTLIREFVAGAAATAVEVRNLSFTGTDYESGASLAGNPITLDAVLSLWKTSAGALDFKVLVGGASKTLQSAIGAIAGLYFNVKDPTYGATGDGTTDDASAIDAAVTAAAVNGGVVFFPPGTYRRTTAMVMPGNVDLMGCGPSASYLKLDATNVDLLSYTTGTTDWQRVQGLRLGNAQNNATNKALVRLNGATRLIVDGCYIGDSHTLGGCFYLTNASAGLSVRDCTIECGTSATYPVQTSSGKFVHLQGNRFVLPATFTSTVVLMASCDLVCVGNAFENGTVTAGTMTCVSTASGKSSLITGNTFSAGGGATVTAMNLGSVDGAFEYGNGIPIAVTAYAFTATASSASHNGCILGTRNSRELIATTDTSGYTVPADQYAVAYLTVTGTGGVSWVINDPVAAGQEFILVVRSTNAGGTGAIVLNSATIGASPVYGQASFTVNTNKASAFLYKAVSVTVGGFAHLSWCFIGSAANFTP